MSKINVVAFNHVWTRINVNIFMWLRFGLHCHTTLNNFINTYCLISLASGLKTTRTHAHDVKQRIKKMKKKKKKCRVSSTQCHAVLWNFDICYIIKWSWETIGQSAGIVLLRLSRWWNAIARHVFCCKTNRGGIFLLFKEWYQLCALF